jgi:hypothetical protein
MVEEQYYCNPLRRAPMYGPAVQGQYSHLFEPSPDLPLKFSQPVVKEVKPTVVRRSLTGIEGLFEPR